jgi:hypothetical protein
MAADRRRGNSSELIMAQVEFDMPAPPVITGRKPKTSVYVVLLVISLVALLVGCLFLFLEIKRYGGFGAVRGRVAQAALSENPEFALQPRYVRLQFS